MTAWGLELTAVLLIAFSLFVYLRRATRTRLSLRDVPGAVLPDENVQFTVYCPREVVPRRWYSLLVFTHLASADGDDPLAAEPVSEVSRQATRILAEDRPAYRSLTQDAMEAVPRHGALTLVPKIDGIEFNPPKREYRWHEGVHREEFHMEVLAGTAPGLARGRLTVFLGRLIVADVPLTVPIVLASSAQPDRALTATTGRVYRRIFASYSRQDLAIVQEFERHVEATGDRYLRDLRDLRSGEEWSPRLEELIRTADVFQLFWSWNSLQSPFVRKEWEYAQGLSRPAFIRPVYWESPFPETSDLPPESLRRLNFHRFESEPDRHETGRVFAAAGSALGVVLAAVGSVGALISAATSFVPFAVGVAVIGILGVIASPGLLRSRIGANEAAAIREMRAIGVAQAGYARAMAGVYGSLDCLSAPDTCIPGYAGPPLFQSAPTYSGYDFVFEASGETSHPTTKALGYKSWVYTAAPAEPGQTGIRTFCTDTTRRICAWDGSNPIVVNGRCDPSCKDIQ